MCEYQLSTGLFRKNKVPFPNLCSSLVEQQAVQFPVIKWSMIYRKRKKNLLPRHPYIFHTLKIQQPIRKEQNLKIPVAFQV